MATDRHIFRLRTERFEYVLNLTYIRDGFSGAPLAAGIEVDVTGSPSLHELPIFDPTRFPVGPWPKAPLDPGQYPAATRYSAGTLSLPTLTGHLDESRLQNTIPAFQKVWNETGIGALGG